MTVLAFRREPRRTVFLLHACRVEIDADGALVATLPARDLTWRGGLPADTARGIQWSDPQPFGYPRVVVPCEPGIPHRYERAAAAEPPGAEDACVVEFNGGVHFGRVPTENGWALHVVAAPLASDPDGCIWRRYAAVEIGPLRSPASASAASGSPASRPGWTERFYEAISLGATVTQAIFRASER